MRALPRPVRLWAARRAVARLKHNRATIASTGGAPSSSAAAESGSAAPACRGGDLSSVCLFATALACSASLGYLGGRDAGQVGQVGQAHAVAMSRDAPADGGQALAGRDGEPFLAAALGDPTGNLAVGSVGGPGDGPDDGSGGGVPVPPPFDPAMAEIGRIHAEILRLRVLFRRLATVAELEDGEFDLDLEPFDLPSVRGVSDGLDLSIRALDPISDRAWVMARVFDERRAAYDRRVGGEVAPGTVRSSGFGPRPSPLGGVYRELHRGIDFAGAPGTPILALADGIVTWSGVNGGYGNLVELDHGDGLRTRYAHNERNLVARGGRVRKGQSIALLGSTGRSTGAHVHVEVRQDGVPLDPAPYLR